MNISRAGDEGESLYRDANGRTLASLPRIIIGDYEEKYGVQCACGNWTHSEAWTRCESCLQREYRALVAEGVLS